MRLALVFLLAMGLTAQVKRDFAEAPAGIRINEIQVLGTHNSYRIASDPRVMAMMDARLGKMIEEYKKRMTPRQIAQFEEEHPHGFRFSESLSYAHPDLKTQLDAGMRGLEIDIHADPAGGLFRNPAAYRILRAQGVKDLAPFDSTGLDQPGLKVLHMPDVDFRSHCPTFRQCLTELREWSDANPGHVPLYIMLEAKAPERMLLPDSAKTVPFDATQFDGMDAEILSVLGRQRVITPDDVRGKYETLNQAVLAKNWPTLEESRGKILFLMITGGGEAVRQSYLTGHSSLKGRVAFLRGNPGEEHAAFLLVDNAPVRQKEIVEWVKAGYLVRTRADIETWEAKVNDLSRAQAAFASGAHVVSTDFFRPGNAYGTPYVVKLPGGGTARCNVQVRPACGR